MPLSVLHLLRSCSIIIMKSGRCTILSHTIHIQGNKYLTEPVKVNIKSSRWSDKNLINQRQISIAGSLMLYNVACSDTEHGRLADKALLPLLLWDRNGLLTTCSSLHRNTLAFKLHSLHYHQAEKGKHSSRALDNARWSRV